MCFERCLTEDNLEMGSLRGRALGEFGADEEEGGGM